MALPAIVANNLLPLGALAPLGPSAAPAPAPAGGVAPAASSLTFPMQTQEQANWCWAAVSVSVAQFYSASTAWSAQCDLASQELGKTCCPAGSNSACDVPWYLDRALQRVGHFNTWGSGPLPLATIRGEIESNRPLGARIGWASGGGHFVVVSGYSTSAAGDFVTVDDPFYAHSTLPLSSFQSSYQGSGSWSHTFWTQP